MSGVGMIASGLSVGWPLPLTFLTFVKPFAFRKTCHSFNSHFRAALLIVVEK
jgi:hypothetical protein